jgi:hypothetical protein
VINAARGRPGAADEAAGPGCSREESDLGSMAVKNGRITARAPLTADPWPLAWPDAA